MKNEKRLIASELIKIAEEIMILADNSGDGLTKDEIEKIKYLYTPNSQMSRVVDINTELKRNGISVTKGDLGLVIKKGTHTYRVDYDYSDRRVNLEYKKKPLDFRKIKEV